jgi:hypothetical protein
MAGQLPALSQEAATVATPPAQEPARQALEGKAQAVRLAPSQTPPQAEPSVPHGVRAPAGDPILAEQIPTRPATLQASHWPLQVLSQQTPSVHRPLAHWLAPEQVAPPARRSAQTPDEHQAVAAQSASIRQLPLQAVAPQAYALQLAVSGAGQAPFKQSAAAVAPPSRQEAARHSTAG